MKREIIGLAGIGVAAPRMAYDYMWWADVWVGVIGRQSADANPARAEVWRGQKKKKGRKRQFKNIPAGASERENPPIQLMRAAINRFRLSDVFNCQIQNDDVFVWLTDDSSSKYKTRGLGQVSRLADLIWMSWSPNFAFNWEENKNTTLAVAVRATHIAPGLLTRQLTVSSSELISCCWANSPDTPRT